MPPTRRPDDTTPPRKPSRDPLDIPLDEPLDDGPDPVDEFRMIEPAPNPKPSRPAPTRLVPSRPAAGNSRPDSPARVRRPARAPEPVAPNRWLLPAGIALAVSLVVFPVILVLAMGAPSKDASPLPAYPVAFAQPGQPGFPQQNLPPMPGGFPVVFTPGVGPEPKAAPLNQNAPGMFERPVEKTPDPREIPKMPEQARVPSPDRAPGLLRGNPPSFLKVTSTVLPAFKGPALTEVDVSNGTGVAVCVGGRGKYLFVAKGTRPQIDVYDLTTALKVRSVVCEDAQYPYIRLLAGTDVLVAMSSATGRATSWRLDDLDRPKTAMLGHIDSRVALLAPGANGPLIVADGREGRRISLFDPATLEPVRYEFASQEEREKFSGSEPTSINSTGTVLTCSPGYVTPPSDLWRISGTSIRRVSEDISLTKLTRAIVSANGDKLVCAETAIDLPSGRLSKWSPPTGNAARAFSVDASEEKFVSATAGGFAEVELWKPGFEESIARLDKDDAAIALIRKTEQRGGTPTRVFCVGRTNVVVMASYDRVLIWHADAERQKGTRRLGGVTVPPMPPKAVVKPVPKSTSPAEVPSRDPLARGEKPAFRAASAEKLPDYTGGALQVLKLQASKTIEPMAACIGGRGRYLFVCTSPATGIQVFDLAAGKWRRVIGWEGAAGPRMHLAAGADYLVATDGIGGKLYSWSIDDLAAPPTEARLQSVGVTGLALGSETNGPLFVGYSAGTAAIDALDPKTLRPVKYDLGTPTQSDQFAREFPVEVDAAGKVLTTTSGRGPTRKYSLWNIGADSILPFDPAIEMAREPVSKVSRGGSMMISPRAQPVRLPARESLPEPLLPKIGERVWSVGPGEEVIATAGSHPEDGLLTTVQVWKPGQKGQLARLSDDPAANALILADYAKFAAPVAQPGRVFCVGGWNLVVIVGDQKVWIWHADPARQKPGAAPKTP